MRYKNLEINYFRGIKRCSIKSLKRVNIFLGQNNSGKSSVLEAVFVLTGANNPRSLLSLDLLRNLLYVEPNDLRHFFYKLDYESKLQIFGEMYEEDETRKLTIVPKSDNSTNSLSLLTSESLAKISTITSTSELDESLDFTVDNQNINTLEFIAEIKKRHQPKVELVSRLSYQKDKNGLPSFNIVIDKSNYKSNFNAVIQSANSAVNDLSKRLENIIIAKNKSQIINQLKVIDKNVNDIAAGSNNMVYLDIGAKRMIPANLMGDGILKFLNIIANINQVPNGVILIDEIDNGLHFSVLKNLWKFLFLVSAQNNTQVFITTHSKEALKLLKDVLEEDKNYTGYQKDLSCYTLSKLDDDTVMAYNFEFPSLEYMVENDLEIRGEI